MTGSYTPEPEEGQEPPQIRRLRQLVMVLTGTLTLAIIIVVGLMTIRLLALGHADSPRPPAHLTLPDEESAQAVTLGTGWIAVVTRDPQGTERIRVFDTDGTPITTTEISK
jgi:hypothetical protein